MESMVSSTAYKGTFTNAQARSRFVNCRTGKKQEMSNRKSIWAN